MSLELHYHPLSSYCWKVLIALYEREVAFTPHLVDLGDPDARAALERLWPPMKFPVLQDHAGGAVVAESSVIIEHLDLHHGRAAPLIPKDPEAALAARFWDRVFDLHIHVHMQRTVAEHLRPPDAKDPFGLEQAKAAIRTGYRLVEAQLAGRTWAVGETFTLADCAAAPALFYADKVEPMGDLPNTRAYLERLKARPSFARVLVEAEPYFAMFPG